MDQEFETRSVRMARMLLVTFLAPSADVERIMAAVVAITPLTMGKYDSNAYQSAGGIERYRPLEGAMAGAEAILRQRPDVVEVSFELPEETLPENRALLDTIIEAIFAVHSYQEPQIRVQRILSSRSKGLDDSKNPHRWWNTTGDWKKNAAAAPATS